MICQACHSLTPGPICVGCLSRLRPASERILENGIRLIAAFEHVGPARDLVHALKYRGLTAFADLVAETVATRVPALPIVPIPRAWSRQVVFGVDPAREIGLRLARRIGVPLLDILDASFHTRRRAGGDHSLPAPGFKLHRELRHPVVLVDDVVTTGATVRAARKSLGTDRLALVVAANAADTTSPRI